MILLKPDRRVARFAARFPADPKDKSPPPGGTWDVHLDLRGYWFCECPDFDFVTQAGPNARGARAKARRGKPCKHILAAAKAQRAATNRVDFDT